MDQLPRELNHTPIIHCPLVRTINIIAIIYSSLYCSIIIINIITIIIYQDFIPPSIGHLDASSRHQSTRTASHPSPGDNLPEHRRAVRKNERPSKHGSAKLTHLHMHQGSPLLPIFRALSCSLHCHPSAAQGHLYIIHAT